MANAFGIWEKGWATFPVFFKSPSEGLGVFDSPCELPLTPQSVEQCRQDVINELNDNFIPYSIPVLVCIPGGKLG